ncbi:hypothetical protein CYMTET_31934 [Cymbomonas tetramitiformis]|uniref:Vacuolar sorting protein 39/Transforming growth factor beta receptor-associated domain-containing protein n=1 Tax=Cymbomonas tetramitiformis TaxID=36881 RepID=A0AAE0KSD1_9CHLO|nr:hypothetical protein CYMTET_31934 [Cymbomonas tetramitiformis]
MFLCCRRAPAQVLAEAGFILMFQLEFERAVNFLLKCNTLDPGELFLFYPQFTAPWLTLAPPKYYWGLHSPPEEMSRVIAQSPKLRGARTVRPRPTGAARGAAGAAGVSGTIDQAQMDAILPHARSAIARFMATIRGRLTTGNQSPHLTAQAPGVDTLLAHLYLEGGQVADLEALMTFSNSCDLDKVGAALKEAGRYHALALLLERRGREHEAVRIWQSLALGELKETTASSGATAVVGEGRAFVVGLQEAARVLASSADEAFVLSNVNWILEISSESALDVLTSTVRQQPLRFASVMELLRKPHEAGRSGTGAGSSSATLCRRYLEHVVYGLASTAEEHHTELALSLLSEALNHREGAAQRGGGEERIAAAQGAAAARDGEEGIRDTEMELGLAQRRRLEEFLNQSQCYNLDTLIAAITNTSLWDAQVILYREAQNHQAALRVLAVNIKDFKRAEQYCAIIARQSGEGQEAYLALLELYLHPGPGEEPMYTEAIQLISAPGVNLNPLRVLDTLSEDTPLKLAVGPLLRILRERTHARRHHQLVLGLKKANHQAAKELWVGSRSQRVQMTNDSACMKCHTRLSRSDGGEARFFAVYPNQAMVCYRCLRQGDQSEFIDPISGRDFRAQPARPQMPDPQMLDRLEIQDLDRS